MLVKIASGSSSRRLAPLSVSSGATSVMEAGPSAAGLLRSKGVSWLTGFQSPSSAENSASVTIGTACPLAFAVAQVEAALADERRGVTANSSGASCGIWSKR
jgi:hypothetical protein